MAFVEINFNPSVRQLRQFSAACLMVLPAAVWIWTHDQKWTGWAGAVGLVLIGIGLVSPSLLRPVYLGMTILTLPIGLIVGELAMLLIYFGVFLPMSILLRIAGQDPLGLKHRSRSTYWRERKQARSADRYFLQF